MEHETTDIAELRKILETSQNGDALLFRVNGQIVRLTRRAGDLVATIVRVPRGH